MAFKDILEKGKAIFSRDEHIEQKTRPSIEQLEEDAKYLAGKAGALKISLWVSKEEGTEKPQGALDDYAKRLAIAEANLAKRKEEHDRLVEANLETGKKGERIERLSNIEKDLETARQTLKPSKRYKVDFETEWVGLPENRKTTPASRKIENIDIPEDVRSNVANISLAMGSEIERPMPGKKDNNNRAMEK